MKYSEKAGILVELQGHNLFCNGLIQDDLSVPARSVGIVSQNLEVKKRHLRGVPATR